MHSQYDARWSTGGGLHCSPLASPGGARTQAGGGGRVRAARGHAGARETDSPSGETHFRVALVSPEFEGLPTIKRHRLVYQVRACICRVVLCLVATCTSPFTTDRVDIPPSGMPVWHGGMPRGS